MESTTRRIFLLQIAAGSSVLAAVDANAQAAVPKLDEKDPMAMALGYVQDTTKADKKKYPKHTADQKCNNCQLFTGKATDALGPCTLFPGKQVTAAGWCSAYVKKAA